MEARGGAFSSLLAKSEFTSGVEVRARVLDGGRVPNMLFGQPPERGGEWEVVRFNAGLARG
jgi:hypothetical protein